MPILSDRDIRARLAKGDLVVTPVDLDSQLGPASIDLRLGNRFRVFKHSDHALIDPLNYDDKKISERITDGVKVEENEYTRLYVKDQPFILHPGEFILASLHEYVEIPKDLIGRLEGRSSLGRIGLLVHSTAGFIDPGYKGNLTLELANVGKLPIKIYPGQRICQLAVEQMLSPAEVGYGDRKGSKYFKEQGATQSLVDKDIDQKFYKKDEKKQDKQERL